MPRLSSSNAHWGQEEACTMDGGQAFYNHYGGGQHGIFLLKALPPP